MNEYAEQFLANAKKEFEEKQENRDVGGPERYDRSRELRDRDRRHDYPERRRGGGDRWQKDDRRSEDRRSDDRRDDRRDGRRGGDRRGGGNGGNDRNSARYRDRDNWDRSRDHRRDSRRRSRSPQESRTRHRAGGNGGYEGARSIVPINEWDRSKSKWDKRPPGYEDISADMAKLSGVFPSPSNPKPDMERLAEVLKSAAEKGTNGVPGASAPAALSNILKAADALKLIPSRAKVSRTVFVSSVDGSELTPDVVISQLGAYLLNLQDGLINAVTPVYDAYLSADRKTLSVELANNDIATIVVALNQKDLASNISYHIARPGNYIAPIVIPESVSTTKPDVPSSELLLKDTSSKITVSNLPSFLNEAQVKELLVAFGEVERFLLLKDRDGGSQGIAFAEFSSPELAEAVCQGLSGTKLGENVLSAEKSCIGIQQPDELAISGVDEVGKLANVNKSDYKSTVIQLLNVISAEDLSNEAEYRDTLEQVQELCTDLNDKTPVDVKIPKRALSLEAYGGRVFVKFKDQATSTLALRQLGGRKYAERTVVAAYYDERNFDMEIFV